MLIQKQNRSQIHVDPKMEEYEIIDAEYGINLDLKEEVFRSVLPVIDVVSLFL